VKEALRRTIAGAWAFRTRVEREAAERFARIGAAIASFDAESPVVPLMERAEGDERRHAALCAELAAAYGEKVGSDWPAAASIAPGGLGGREAILYEVVASCCITETESVATVATLLAGGPEPSVRDVLHQIARDEVVHGRMGWAHLAREAQATEERASPATGGGRRPEHPIDVSFLSRCVPAMLSGTVDDALFAGKPADPDQEELLRYGVLPAARKKEIFVRTLEEVVFPGFEAFGIDPAPGRAWLRARTG
jgi:hypothetical protein